VCDRPLTTEFARFPGLSRITSDCRSFRNGGRLLICDCCGAVQKIADEKWLKEIGEIYAAYSVYEQGGGEEQKAVDPQTGKLAKRSDIIATQLDAVLSLADGDSILDVGCGNGATLAALSKRFPACSLYGSELNGSTRSVLESIAGFQQLYTVPVQEIGRRFDLVCMVHSLEHFENPLEQLKNTLPLISEKGHLFIEVCNVRENPFDLLVADHLMHFSADSLSHLLTLAGYDVVSVKTNWVGKELSALAKPRRSESARQQL
jgi:SAM-dependent methyltransferase